MGGLLRQGPGTRGFSLAPGSLSGGTWSPRSGTSVVRGALMPDNVRAFDFGIMMPLSQLTIVLSDAFACSRNYGTGAGQGAEGRCKRTLGGSLGFSQDHPAAQAIVRLRVTGWGIMC